jgi:catechol 2,3-dioxygenase-like lactoylglutathione lyase family enzyme
MSDNWELNHVGIVVTKKDWILHYLQSLEIAVSVGPQPLLPYIEGEVTVMMYRTLEGDPMSSSSSTRKAHTFFDAETQIGSCQLECIQVGPGSFIGEYLEKNGEGINHLCFNVPDVVAETDKLLKKGCGLMFSVVAEGQIIENYLDTRKHGDLIISFRPPAGDWEKTWKANNMAHPLVSDWKFRGVGIAVKDLDKTVAYYEFLGLKSAQPEAAIDASTCSDLEVNGKRPDTPVRLKSRLVEVGPLQYEFVQPVEGETAYNESLDKRGEGVSNMAFTVGDLEAETAKLAGNGVDVLLRGTHETGGSFAYFDTRKVGNIMVKLIQA